MCLVDLDPCFFSMSKDHYERGMSKLERHPHARYTEKRLKKATLFKVFCFVDLWLTLYEFLLVTVKETRSCCDKKTHSKIFLSAHFDQSISLFMKASS